MQLKFIQHTINFQVFQPEDSKVALQIDHIEEIECELAKGVSVEPKIVLFLK